MINRAVRASPASQPGQGAIRRRSLKGPLSATPRVAVSLAAMTFMLLAPPAGAEPCGDPQTSAFEAARASTSVPAARQVLKFAEAPAQANVPPQIDSHPSLPEEAPHMVPVLQPPAAAQTKSDPSQPSLPEEAPHIVPVMPEGPGAAPTQVPAE